MMFDCSSRSQRAHRFLGAAAAFGAAAVFSWGVASQTALAPQPAQAKDSLSGTNGATGAAYYIEVKPQMSVLKWPSMFVLGGSHIPAGTPCSNVDLIPGDTVVMHIQAAGSYRRCNGLYYPAMSGPRPSPNAIIVTHTLPDGSSKATQVGVRSTTIVKWPAEWTTQQPMPTAGTPCSPVDMQAGEPTSLHVQHWMAGQVWSRCIENTLPPYAS